MKYDIDASPKRIVFSLKKEKMDGNNSEILARRTCLFITVIFNGSLLYPDILNRLNGF
jgi:hypothetical protein